MSLPTRDDIPHQGSLFWVVIFAVWLILIVIGVTLALALGIWNLLEAF